MPYIVLGGADWFKALGPEGSPGTSIYSLSGRIANPGQYEAPMGTTMRGAHVNPDLAEKLLRDAAAANDDEFDKLKRVAAVAAEPTSSAITPPKPRSGSAEETILQGSHMFAHSKTLSKLAIFAKIVCLRSEL